MLDDQYSLMLFLRSRNSKSKSLFDRVAIVDIDLDICGCCPVSAQGSDDFGTVSANENGRELISISENRGKWKLLFNMIIIKTDHEEEKKIFYGRNCTVEFPKENKILKAPVALCYAYLKDLLIVSCESGNMYICKVLKSEVESKKPKVTLDEKACVDLFPEQGEGLLRDSFRKFILSWDQKCLIGLTRLSVIKIMRLKKKSVSVIRQIDPMGTVVQINLSLNGRFLMQCGTFFTSVVMFDLAQVREESFGENGQNCLTRARDKATKEGKKNGDGQSSMQAKFCFYRFNTFENYHNHVERQRENEKALRGRNWKKNKASQNQRNQRRIGDDDSISEENMSETE